MTIEEHIQAASARNAVLCQTLTETDYAKPSLAQQRGYIADLESELKQVKKRLTELDKRRDKDLMDHVKYRDSVFRRFAYKASGRREKFDEKAAQEEKEYFEGMQETNTKQEEQRQLQGLLDEANTRRGELERDAQRHEKAQKELDGLYDSIFGGPNPSQKFPEEDRLEKESEGILGEYEQHRQTLEGEERGLRLLQGARKEMTLALRHLASARGYSTWDMWGGGTMVDMMERNELSSADKQWSAVKTLHLEAQHSSRNIQPLPQVRVAAGSLMSDVFFDNIFTDMAFHEKIKQSEVEMRRADEALAGQLQAAQERVEHGQAAMRDLSGRLEQARVALQKRRMEIFRQISAA